MCILDGRNYNKKRSLKITAKATDPDGDNLTYTLCDASGNAISGVNAQTVGSGQAVTFTHSGLGNFSTHTYTVKVSDGKATISEQCTGTTYCLGSYCSGYRREDETLFKMQ